VSEQSSELVVQDAGELIAPTGEVLPATTENAHYVLSTAREWKLRLNEVIERASAFLSDESRRLGTKTIHTEAGDLTASGGVAVEIDADALEDLLREAGCPENRIREVCVEEVVRSVKVDRRVLRQLTASNEDYRAAAEMASREFEKPLRWSAK
jgi:hypothetical protein